MNYPFSKPIFYLVLSLLFCGAVLLYPAVHNITQGLQRNHWPVTTGTVLESHVAGTRASRPEIIYQYQIDNKVYTDSTDLQTPGFGNRRYRRMTAERIINQYPAGSAVSVHYDPADPSCSLIRPGPYWSDYQQLVLSLIFLVSGGIGTALFLFKRLSSGPLPVSPNRTE
jgi:hypothetical protein